MSDKDKRSQELENYLTETFCKHVRILMNHGMSEEDAKAKVKEIMHQALMYIEAEKTVNEMMNIHHRR